MCKKAIHDTWALHLSIAFNWFERLRSSELYGECFELQNFKSKKRISLRMDKRVFISVFLVLALTVLIYKANTDRESKVIENSKNKVAEKTNSKPSETLNIITAKQVIHFNEEFTKSMSFQSDSNKVLEVSKLKNKYRNDTADVLEAIEDYVSDVGEHPIQVNELASLCRFKDASINHFEKNYDKEKIIDIDLNNYLFFKGVDESKICRKFKKRDPFYIFLDMARKGDLEQRVLLLENIGHAIDRGAIKVYEYPARYKEVRDEAEFYLQELASKGVYHASARLSSQYQGGSYLPKDRVKEYYYAYLANRQGAYNQGYPEKNLEQMYARLNERDKKIVDRMIKKL